MSLVSGTNLEGYEILSLLGSGGMGEVYRARDVSLRRDVAIKVLPAFVSRDPERLRRFEQEARATAALNHPNIVAVYQFGAFEGAPYLVSELLEGETLRQIIRRGALPNRKAIEYAVQIARGLAAAHEKGIVHRDLKPENLFVTNDGRLKILDFGIAKFVEAQAQADGEEAAMTHATDAGVVMGTAGYMSPEQVRGKAVDYRTDIFAFGAILYEMLSGKRAFHRSTSVETMTSILNDHPTEISQIVQTIPPGLQRVVNRCLEKNPEQRFQSASDLAFALEALTESGSSAAFLTTETRATAIRASGSFSRRTDRPRRRVPWSVVAGAVVLAALAVAGWFYFKRFEGIPFAHFIIQRAMDSDHVRMTAISPDGMYLASVVEEPNHAESLNVRQIPTNTERAILNNPQFTGYGGLSFSPDGSYIYFRVSALGNPPPDRSDVYRIAVLGGSPERVLMGVDEPAMFINGGQRMCFYREDTAAGTYQFVSASAEGGDEQILANGKAPFPAVAACDPKGERAVVEDELGKVEVLSFAGGAKRTLIEMAPLGGYLTDLHWYPNGKGLFGIVRKQPTFVGQLVYLSYPGGVLSPITNDLSSYAGVSLTADARTLATRQTDNSGRLEVVDVADATRQEEYGPRGLRHFTWLDDNTIVASDQMSQLRMIDLQKEDTTTLHAAKGHWFMEPALCGADTFVTVGGTLDKSAMHIYKMSHDGSLATQLTEGPYDVYPSCTPDGKYLFFADNHNPMQPVIKRLNMGVPNAQAEPASNGFRYTLSSDGKLLGVIHLGGSPQLRILSAATLEKVQNVSLPPDVFRFAAFSADDRSIFFPTMTGADTTLWRLSLDGGAAVKMATFPGKTVQWIRLSPDGQKLGLILETPQSEAVLLHDSR